MARPFRPLLLAALGCAALGAAAMTSAAVAPATAQTAPKPAAAAPKADAAKPAGTKPADTLPGGSSSLQESFEDWTVNCGLPGGRRVCVLAQVQTDPQSKKRALAIEIGAADGKSLTGVVALPFGLDLTSGATVQIDTAAALPTLPFRVCLPAGCMVPFAFEGETLAQMKSGQQMKITTRAFEGGQPLAFTVSLKGFAAGLARLQALL